MDKKKPTTTSTATGGQKSKQIPSSSKAAATASAEQPDNVPRKRRILQNFRLIWLDAHIDETKDDFRNSVSHLRCIVNTIDPFTDPDQCVDFLSEIKDENVFMIVSGALGQHMVPLLHDMTQLNAIYVFCGNKSRHEQWAKDWSKVKGVFTDIKPICDSLKQVARQCDQDSISISLVPASQASNQNLDQLDPSFMYTKILKEILLEIDNYNEQSIKELTAYCREQCADLKNIAKFENDYPLPSPIWWYTSECCLYPMLNRALRTQEMDTVIKMGFFIRDLDRQIQQLHDEQFGHHQLPTLFIVYRGQGLSQKDFENMQKTKGGLLAFNNFLSTSKKLDISLGFAQVALTHPENVGILFKMTIDPAVSSAPFANVEKVSCCKEEEEILFSMHTVFRIHDIVPIGENNRLWQVELTLTADNDQQLNALTERMRQETFPESKGWYRLGELLIKAGESDRAEQVYRVLLGQARSDSEKGPLYNQLGRIKYNQGVYPKALSYYEKDLEISQKCLPPNHPDLAASYNNIGLVYDNMGEYSKALSYYEKALEIKQSLPPNHPDLATSYNNIGNVYYSMGDYSKALSHYEKSLEIRQSLPPNHSDLAGSYNNIGTAYEKMGDYSTALSSHEKALEIRQKSLPPNHPDLAASYTNIGLVYYNMGEYSKALSYYEKALEIQQKSLLPPNHPHLGLSYKNIGNVYYSMGDYSKALSYYEKDLEISQKSLPPNHPDLAGSYNNIGTAYEKMGDYSTALSSHEKALEIRQKSLPPNHPHLAFSYNNIGEVYNKNGEYSKALSYYEKSLTILQSSLPPNHPNMAHSYNNFGEVYENMDEYSKALTFYERAVEIAQRSLAQNHPDLQKWRRNLENVKKLSK